MTPPVSSAKSKAYTTTATSSPSASSKPASYSAHPPLQDMSIITGAKFSKRSKAFCRLVCRSWAGKEGSESQALEHPAIKSIQFQPSPLVDSLNPASLRIVSIISNISARSFTSRVRMAFGTSLGGNRARIPALSFLSLHFPTTSAISMSSHSFSKFPRSKFFKSGPKSPGLNCFKASRNLALSSGSALAKIFAKSSVLMARRTSVGSRIAPKISAASFGGSSERISAQVPGMTPLNILATFSTSWPWMASAASFGDKFESACAAPSGRRFGNMSAISLAERFSGICGNDRRISTLYGDPMIASWLKLTEIVCMPTCVQRYVPVYTPFSNVNFTSATSPDGNRIRVVIASVPLNLRPTEVSFTVPLPAWFG
mmetsp:Transcript_4735/g.16289  ORF Transcript_4735/g.16289 Transcript_4735/m.16289 type:complete len:371 (+) Transcript_4735:11208-12320(+)